MTLVGEFTGNDYCVIIYSYETKLIIDSLKDYYFKVINDPVATSYIKTILDDLGGLR